MLGFIKLANEHRSHRAIIDKGQEYSYESLLMASYDVAASLLDYQRADLEEERIAFMVSPGFDYVAVQWGIWRAGGVAVPLCVSYPLPSLQYVIEDTGASVIVAGAEYVALLRPLAQAKGLRLIAVEEIQECTGVLSLPKVQSDRRAMILYTSGTTNLPKGVVSTHHNIKAQVSTLVEAWHWSAKDHILCVLPLHHVHGIINVIACALWSGATVEFLPSFTTEGVFSAFSKGHINLFMAVPTIYFKLIAYWEEQPPEVQRVLTNTLSAFRLMVSGSAALPVSVMQKWQQISKHTLLERYGMTEIGMGISNPYEGERRAGHIGQPLKGVQVRLVDEHNKKVKPGQAGEIQIKGANVFLEYWNKPEATAKAFTPDGWFRTGDVAVVDDGYYRILGRDSIDIIKSGGYKISALEIEEVLRTHSSIKDCSVVGVPNDEWGELVVAVLVLSEPLDVSMLNQWIREKMPAYKVPRAYKIVDELPRNAMGKVTKNGLKPLFA